MHTTMSWCACTVLLIVEGTRYATSIHHAVTPENTLGSDRRVLAADMKSVSCMCPWVAVAVACISNAGKQMAASPANTHVLLMMDRKCT